MQYHFFLAPKLAHFRPIPTPKNTPFLTPQKTALGLNSPVFSLFFPQKIKNFFFFKKIHLVFEAPILGPNKKRPGYLVPTLIHNPPKWPILGHFLAIFRTFFAPHFALFSAKAKNGPKNGPKIDPFLRNALLNLPNFRFSLGQPRNLKSAHFGTDLHFSQGRAPPTQRPREKSSPESLQIRAFSNKHPFEASEAVQGPKEIPPRRPFL